MPLRGCKLLYTPRSLCFRIYVSATLACHVIINNSEKKLKLFIRLLFFVGKWGSFFIWDNRLFSVSIFFDTSLIVIFRRVVCCSRTGSQQVLNFCGGETNGFVDYGNLFSSLIVDYFTWSLRVFSLPLFLFKMDKSIVQDRVGDCKDTA